MTAPSPIGRTKRVVAGSTVAVVLVGLVGLAIADDATGPDLGPPATASAEANGVTSQGDEAPTSAGDPDLDPDRQREPGAPLPTSAAGNVIKRIGESASLLEASGGAEQSEAFQLTVHEATTASSCPGRLGRDMAPESGAFLVLDVEVRMAEGIMASLGEVADEDVLLPLGAEAFVAYDRDGVALAESASASAWACFADEELLAPFIAPGEVYRGLVVLDARDAASVAYQPGGAAGWEWSLSS